MPNHLKHGLTGSPLFQVWRSMKVRCTDENARSYPRYGGRGISVCEEWMDSSRFFQWALDNGYDQGLQLDRIDNNGDYTPSNCRWVTPSENARNRSDNVYVDAFGESKLLLDWFQDDRCHANSIVTLRGRLRRGWHPERAIATPSRRYG